MLAVAPILCALLGTAVIGHAQRTSLADQIADHEEKLADARARQPNPDFRTQAIELNTLASLYRQQGKNEKALDELKDALEIERRFHGRAGEAQSLNLMGRIDTDLGQEEKALELFQQILPVWRELGNRQGEASTLTNMGRAYSDLADEDRALDLFNQSLTIWREVGGRSGEASALDGIGRVYLYTSRGTEALSYLSQALVIWREVGERGGEALTLNNLGRTYTDLGQMKEMLASYRQALAIWREIGNRQGEASTLGNLGRASAELGQRQTALEYMEQALPIWHEVGNRNGEALVLNDMGRVESDLHEDEKAEDFYARALALWREVGNRRGEALTLMNQGRLSFEEGKLDAALQTDYESLPLWREVKSGRGEALALSSISKIYGRQGQTQKALASAMAALYRARDARDPDLEGGIETLMMVGFRNHNQPRSAIYFGYEAVNSYQRIRGSIVGLEKDLQAAFAQSKSETYRILAELLVEQDRLGEAEQILDLLKEQELKGVVRGTAQDTIAQQEGVKLTHTQQKVEGELAEPEKQAFAFEDLVLQSALLRAKASRTGDEEAQLKSLDAGIEKQGVEFAQFLDRFGKAMVSELKDEPGSSSNTSGNGQVPSSLQNTLAKLGPNAIGVRVLFGQRHVYLILVKGDSRKKVELPAAPADLRAKALAVRDQLASRSTDPRPHLEELYAALVAPMRPDLDALTKAAGRSAPVLLWSLDDALRYVPMAALYDGQRYMVEQFRNVLFTPSSYSHMADAPMGNGLKPTVLALGLSKSYGGLPALPGVMPELEAVVHDPAVPESHGVMEGKLLPDNEFTRAALTAALGAGNTFSVVHIASHFVEEADGQEPFLMLSGDAMAEPDGFAWNLSAMENSQLAFRGTHLLTLSACSTARDYTSRDGVEMDSLGMVAQQKEAQAVLATLWDVNDASTSRLMSDFYTRWIKNPEAGKAEALRQAQTALLRSSGAAEIKTARGIQVETESPTANQKAQYALPYYWAPFVLIGNYQ